MKMTEFYNIINLDEIDNIWEIDEQLRDLVERVATELNRNDNKNKHCVIGTNVYKFEDGFLGITGPCEWYGDLWFHDLKYPIIVQEYIEVPVITYKPKK